MRVSWSRRAPIFAGVRSFAGAFCILAFLGASAIGQKADPKRINISRESGSATVSATLSDGQEFDLVVYLAAGQNIKARVTSNQGSGHFELRIAGGIFELSTEEEGTNELEFTVPESGDHFFTVVKRPVKGVRRARAVVTISVR
jgi:hypothetical protein